MATKRVETNFEKPDASPGFLLWQVANIWQRRQRAALKPLDLTHVQFVLLTVLTWTTRDSDDGMSQVALANEAKTDVMMTSQVLRVLAARGLVERLSDPRDSRANLVRVTSEGRDLANQALPIVEAVDRDFFGAHSEEATMLLRRLVDSNDGRGASNDGRGSTGGDAHRRRDHNC